MSQIFHPEDGCILANVNGTLELATVVSVGSDYIAVRAYERKRPKRVTRNSKINKVFKGESAVKDAEAWIHAQRAINRDEEMQ